MIRGGGGAEWLVAGLSLLRSQLQITISEQFNIPHNTPHQAVSRQIVSLTRAGMPVMITLVLNTSDAIQCFYLS